MSKLKRLDQLLGSLGYGARREAQGIILRGQVTVKGEVVERPDTRVDPADVLVKGQPLEGLDGLLIALFKPTGYVCTRTSDEGSNIYELIPPRWMLRNPSVTSVGRLDKDTSGLILLTDRGDLVQRWTSPKSDIEKTYEVTVDKPLDPALGEVFASGELMLKSEDKPCLPAKFEIISELRARLILREGRYHQVKRMFASQGWHVSELHRSQIGPYNLEGLEPGQWRLLDAPAIGGQFAAQA